MKIILTTDVNNLGVAGDAVEVKDGYARNFLLPSNFAIPASRGAVKQVEGIKRAQSARTVRDIAHAQEIKSNLEKLDTITVAVKTSQSNRLFGSVTNNDIVQAIKAAGGPAIDKRSVSFPQGHVKSLGTVKVKIAVHPQVEVVFPVAITAQN